MKMACFAIVLFACSIAGCAALAPDVRERADDAFRKQNRLSAELMLMGAGEEAPASGLYAGLFEYEAAMLNACQPLNTIAAKRRDNQRVTLHEKRAVLDSLDPCESAATVFEARLQAFRERSSRP